MAEDDTTTEDEQAQELLADAADETENEETGTHSAEDTSSQQTERDDPESTLGDKGKRAIDAMKRERNAARRELKTAQQKLKEYEDKDKSEAQRLQEAAEEAKSKAATAETSLRKTQTALDRAPKHATLAHIRAVAKRLHGDTDEDLDADADELFALLAPEPSTENDTSQNTPMPTKPREKLRGGGVPDEEVEETDPRKLADAIGRFR